MLPNVLVLGQVGQSQGPEHTRTRCSNRVRTIKYM